MVLGDLVDPTTTTTTAATTTVGKVYNCLILLKIAALNFAQAFIMHLVLILFQTHARV